MTILQLMEELKQVAERYGDLPVTGYLMDDEVDRVVVLQEDGTVWEEGTDAVEVYLTN